MRIYRDIRFSKDKRPYHTAARLVFWEGHLKRTDNPSYFLYIKPTGSRIYAGLHMFQNPMLTKFRNAVVEEQSGTELQKALDSVQKWGVYKIGGEHYKRIPSGYDPDHPRAEILRYNALWAISPTIETEALYKQELVDICFEHCYKMSPIQQWLVKLQQ
jgi:uncharacterized protein (TIGR02453 family)